MSLFFSTFDQLGFLWQQQDNWKEGKDSLKKAYIDTMCIRDLDSWIWFIWLFVKYYIPFCNVYIGNDYCCSGYRATNAQDRCSQTEHKKYCVYQRFSILMVWFLGSSQSLILPQLPQKILHASKVVKNDSKIIILLCSV